MADRPNPMNVRGGVMQAAAKLLVVASLFFAANRLCAGEGTSALQFGGVPVELAVSEVSDRTVRLELFPLDEQGHPRTGAPSTVLVPFPAQEKLRIRELPKAREVRVGKLRVTLKPGPL